MSVVTLMIVGDSISHGSSGDWTWRYRLFKHLKQHDVTLDFVGPRSDLDAIATPEPGDGDATYADPDFDPDHNAQWGRPYCLEMAEIARKVAAHRPQYLLVLLGINDLFWYGHSADQNEANLRAFISNARTGNHDVKIILGTVLDTHRASVDPEFNARVSEFNRRLILTAGDMTTARSPIVIAATHAEFVASAHTWDGTHPNGQGELRIAAAFADTLSGQFGVGAPYPRPFPLVVEARKPAPAL
ncbi:GDSL family lipase [Herbidospora galbida]|uniref:GDSL family lipase n=1 Tax=Herbidospora galbida TaxID=2575442 RepID=A0A4U3MAS6_9ACTN|nr:GDSL-type esterase/lipase family protein [Herbidospora galbida]TKK86248.1 GDSL family lipase [Herbidospora galbida]